MLQATELESEVRRGARRSQLGKLARSAPRRALVAVSRPAAHGLRVNFAVSRGNCGERHEKYRPLARRRHLLADLLRADHEAARRCAFRTRATPSTSRSSASPSSPSRSRQPVKYDVVIDRLTHWYDTSREWIKKGVLMDGLYVFNNPWSVQSMEKHTSYAAMTALGMPDPRDVDGAAQVVRGAARPEAHACAVREALRPRRAGRRRSATRSS